MELLWTDGVPTLHSDGQSWRLDRHWIETCLDEHNLEIPADHGLVSGAGGRGLYQIPTHDGPLAIPDRAWECRFVGACREGGLPTASYQDQSYIGTEETQVVLTNCWVESSHPLEFLRLISCRPVRMPPAAVVWVECDCVHHSEAEEVPLPEQICAEHYLRTDGNGCGALHLAAPVIYLSTTTPSWRDTYHCQVLVVGTLAMGQQLPEEDLLRRLHRHSTAEYLVRTTGCYRRTAEGFRALEPEETLPEGTPGVQLGSRYRDLPYAVPPSTWVGDRPPPFPGYRVALVTPPATVWVRIRAKGAHTAQ